MNRHLSSQEIEEWLIGQRTPNMEAHLGTCQTCSDEVDRLGGPLHLFGSAVRGWAERMGPLQVVEKRPRAMVRWRMGMAAAALLALIAVPVYRREEANRQAAAIATAAQDEILLRQVESGLSRSVPAPMEPLAKLISSDVSR